MPKIGIPLIEEATLEHNEELHDRWSNLLTNSLDPNYTNEIKRSYIDILKSLEPIDALILDTLKKSAENDTLKLHEVMYSRDKLTQFLKTTEITVENSLRNLMRLGCVRPGIVEGGLSFGSHKASSYKDTEFVIMTQYGLNFVEAVSDPNIDRQNN